MLKMHSILITLYFLGHSSFLGCYLWAFLCCSFCNPAPGISSSCLIYPSPLSTSLLIHLHSSLHLRSVVISSATSVYFCLYSSLICYVFCLAPITSHLPIYVFFLYFLADVHLFCPWAVGITRWICCQYLQRTQTLAVYFLGSQDESIIINFSWNVELPVFSASKN
ncbi:hypothetical protein HJG60_008636 [Phyllostomus discolor]|uniref:Uncharacterized protein n=1 Tax=Phyllostomus discolor TaxID=89673 RepID=A0A833Z3T2_9CHIR|nr:hypothetical protein HJG60_008636 [Phyllostomus discolor]